MSKKCNVVNGEDRLCQISGVKHFRVLFLGHTGSCSVLSPPPLWSVNLEVALAPALWFLPQE